MGLADEGLGAAGEGERGAHLLRHRLGDILVALVVFGADAFEQLDALGDAGA